ncbi:MAG: hypothetical protein ABR974_00710 [Bacteroidales bacterium]|jgi:hypothetical protein
MSTKKITLTNKTLYFIVFVVIVAAFFMLGGGPWVRGMIHGNRTMGLANWIWPQLLISLGLGFVLGLVASRRKK